MSTMTLADTIIQNLRRRRGFDRAFDLDDDILEEIQQEMADAIDAHLRERESAKAGVTDEIVYAAWEAHITSRGWHAYHYEEQQKEQQLGMMRAALEAVAPHLASARVPEDAEAVSACLGDDATTMLDDNPEDERALNMQRAAQIIESMLAATKPEKE